MSDGIRVLVVDDERPDLEELAYLLHADDRVDRVATAADGLAIDAVLLDLRPPGPSGLDLAKVLSRFRRPPRVVFVTYETHAIAVLGLQAVDYLPKPVSMRRLAEAVCRVAASRHGSLSPSARWRCRWSPESKAGRKARVRRVPGRLVEVDHCVELTAGADELVRARADRLLVVAEAGERGHGAAEDPQPGRVRAGRRTRSRPRSRRSLRPATRS